VYDVVQLLGNEPTEPGHQNKSKQLYKTAFGLHSSPA
jgi:hypothetical protein